MSKKHALKIQTPYRAVVGSPEVLCCGVNSVNESNQMDGGMYRTQTGQLVSINRDGIPVVIPEYEFSDWRKQIHEKYGK